MSKKNKCRRVNRIAKQHNSGNIFCYRKEVAHLVPIKVGADGYNTCACQTCPLAGQSIPQDFD